MKRAAILVLAIATLVMIVSPSAYPLASAYPTKSGSGFPSTIAPGSTDVSGPATTSQGGGTGGGTDQGDADGLSGVKNTPDTGMGSSSMTMFTERFAVTAMMWWRFMLFIR